MSVHWEWSTGARFAIYTSVSRPSAPQVGAGPPQAAPGPDQTRSKNRTGAPGGWHLVRLLGLDFAALRRPEVEDVVVRSIGRGKGGWIVTANLDILRQCTRDRSLAALVGRADMVVADGTPLVWASRLARRPLPERVAGSDMIWTLSEAAAAGGRSIYLLGGSPGSAEKARDALTGRVPTLRVAGWDCPVFSDAEWEASVAASRRRLELAAPDIVYVGLGFPKQDRVIDELRDALPSAWFVGVGVSIDFAAGVVKRAPRWTHGTGLEWVYRLLREPRKLFARYLVDGVPFAFRLFAWAALARRRSPSAGPADATSRD